MTTSWTRWVAIVVGATIVIQGAWAFVDPRSFYDTVATFEPYHPHFLRDIGSALIGVGAAAAVAALHPRALVAGLTGLTAFQVLHVISHVIDRDHGGNPAVDIPGFTLLALLTAAALAVELRRDRRQA